MVQRVELVPASVRGYGNVVSPKVVGDFEVFDCSLSLVDGVYSMVYGAGVVSVALAVSPATVIYGQSVVLEATVLEDDSPLEGVTVQFFDGNSVLGTGTSDVNGVASLTVSDLSVGTHSVNAQYEDSSSNSVTVTVNVPYTDITLTSDKDTLSYADGDSATVSVQLVDGQGSAVSYAGETVTFEVHKVSDDSLVETLTPGTTNSSGIATTTMNSRGTGDVYIKSSCGLVSKTYSIQDCTRYDTTEYTTRQDVQWAMPTGDFEVSADFYHTSNSNSFPQLYIGTELNVNNIAYGKIYGSKYGAEFKKNGSRLTLIETNADLSDNTYHTIKLTRVGDLYSVICDNGETLTYSNTTILPTYLFIIYVPQSKIKNIKIKPL